MIEHKAFDVECKGLDDDAGTLDFYAAAFNNVDRANERIEPGAFKNLDRWISEGFIAAEHDWKQLPIATVDHAEQDARGLRVRAHFHSTPAAQAVRTTIKERLARGKSVKASIGYQVLDDEDVKLDGKSIRSLKSIELYEASIVNVPCNPSASVVAAKSLIDAGQAQAFIDEFKAGRALSAANLSAMRRWVDQARQYASLADEMQQLIDQHDPPKLTPPTMALQPEVGKSFLTGMELYQDFLATCAKYRA